MPVLAFQGVTVSCRQGGEACPSLPFTSWRGGPAPVSTHPTVSPQHKSPEKPFPAHEHVTSKWPADDTHTHGARQPSCVLGAQRLSEPATSPRPPSLILLEFSRVHTSLSVISFAMNTGNLSSGNLSWII